MEKPASSERSEEDLLRDAQAGSRGAFEKLSEKNRSDLLRYAASRIGPELRGRLEAEDVVQDTFLKAYQGLNRFQWKGPESFRRWLCAIAEHLIRNASRGRATSLQQLSLDMPSDDSAPSKGLRREERFDRLQRSITALSPDHRKVIELARIRGLKIQEIADRMGRSPGAVKQLLSRAIDELKKRFGDTVSLNLPARALETEADDTGAGGSRG